MSRARAQHHSGVSRRLRPIHLRLQAKKCVTPLSRAHDHLQTCLCGLPLWWATGMHALIATTTRASDNLILVQASKNAKRQVAYQFTEEALQEAGARAGVPPFAIVASNTMDMSVGR